MANIRLIYFIYFQAYERRFPTCKYIPVVLGCDIISDVCSADGATQIIERRCKLNVDAPYLLKKVNKQNQILLSNVTVLIIICPNKKIRNVTEN